MFLRLAEEMGLIVPIGEIVLDVACGRAAEWLAIVSDSSRFRMSVNLEPPAAARRPAGHGLRGAPPE